MHPLQLEGALQLVFAGGLDFRIHGESSPISDYQVVWYRVRRTQEDGIFSGA
jgi:hypothetical protein